MGIYSDPGHVFAYGGEIRKEFSIRVACTITGGSLSVSNESTDVRFFAPEDIPGIQIHESILIRIRDYLSAQSPGNLVTILMWHTWEMASPTSRRLRLTPGDLSSA